MAGHLALDQRIVVRIHAGQLAAVFLPRGRTISHPALRGIVHGQRRFGIALPACFVKLAPFFTL
jgi:hypothetical protein